MTALRTLVTLLASVPSAARAAQAAEAGRRPAAQDLRRLGIDPAAYRGIGRA